MRSLQAEGTAMSGSIIQIDEHGVSRKLADGKTERVAWADLQEVLILTTADGPFGEDVYIVLAGRDGSGCVVPQSAPESSQLLERLQRLPGFDNAAVIRAMGSAEDARFVCWRAEQGESGKAGDSSQVAPRRKSAGDK
jgi:hypothetical protein